MSDVPPQHLVWRISSKSAGTNCVEIARTPDIVLARDSKNRDGEILSFTSSAWRAFIRAVQSGQDYLG